MALARGASEIYALYVYDDLPVHQLAELARGVSSLLVRSVSMTMQNLVKVDLMLATQTAGVQLHNIHIPVADPPDIVDFSHADRLFAVGYQRVTAYLASHSPRHRRIRLQSAITQPVAVATRTPTSAAEGRDSVAEIVGQ